MNRRKFEEPIIKTSQDSDPLGMMLAEDEDPRENSVMLLMLGLGRLQIFLARIGPGPMMNGGCHLLRVRRRISS